jgi:MarR family transcriptional regulator, temperature-dependent positive regulator of motility
MASKMDEGLARSPVHLLHRAGQCAEELFQAEIGDADLTARQLAVLTAVAEEEGLSQTGIVERTGIDRSTLADIVRRLSKKGLLQRRRTREDARAYAVKLTGEGEKLLRKVGPAAKKVDQRILQAMGGGKDDFLDRLQGMIEKLQPSSTE